MIRGTWKDDIEDEQIWRSILEIPGLNDGQPVAKVLRTGGSWQVFVLHLGQKSAFVRPDVQAAKQAAEDSLVCLAHRINHAIGDGRT